MSAKGTVLFGGSFDPVHNGHIWAAVQIREKLKVAKAVFVPNYQNPLKSGGDAPAEKRFDMLRAACDEISGLEVSGIETGKKSVSYTVETLRLWKQSDNQEPLWFAMGREIFPGITKWKDCRDIFEMANVAVISRRGHADTRRELPSEIKRDFQPVGGADARFIHKSGRTLLFLETDAPDISSTRIRKLLKNGEDIRHLVPQAVADFIKSNKLYTGEPER